MNDDLTLLASAYLDGDVTADERARVESGPEIVAEVERLRLVRALLGDVDPPSISVREAQLSVALDAWDRLPQLERTGARRDNTPVGVDGAALAGAAAVSAPTPLSGRRRSSRPSSTRWLTGAAAALVLVLAGGVAFQLTATDDGDTTDDASTAAATADAVEATQAPQDAARDNTAAEATPQAADTAGGSAELDTGIDSAAPPGENVGLTQLDTLADLADFAAAAVGAPSAPDLPAATSAASDEDLSEAETFLAEAEFPRCLGVDTVVGPAVFGDIAVVVGIDNGRDLAIAYRAANCAEVARVRLP